jgi:hypothetical protein
MVVLVMLLQKLPLILWLIIMKVMLPEGLTYDTNNDLAQSTSYQNLCHTVGNGADESCSGTLQFFEPSSTTFVKHFITNCNQYRGDNISENVYSAGYGNTTSAINAVDFKFSSGNIDAGTILYVRNRII